MTKMAKKRQKMAQNWSKLAKIWLIWAKNRCFWVKIGKMRSAFYFRLFVILLQILCCFMIRFPLLTGKSTFKNFPGP